MQLLVESFNPNSVAGLVCRNTLSIGWRGEVYDYDFNLERRCRRTTISSAVEAVAAEGDGSIFQSLRIDIPEEERAAIFPLHSEFATAAL